MIFLLPQWNSFFQLKHNWSSSSSFQTLLVLMAKQELCWPWRCCSSHQTPGERCWWECLSWGLGGCSWSPPLSRGTTRKAGVWLKPPAVLSGGPAAQPNTQGLIPEWGTGGKHCLTPRIGLVELPCPWRKLSKEAGEGGDPVTYFTYSYCLTDKSRAPLICHRWMTAFYIEQQLLIYIYKSCWFYLCPDVWKRKQLSPTSLRGY